MAAQEVQKELLHQLYALRDEFYDQLQSQPAGGNADTTQLQDQLRRAEYRVSHLKRAIDELLASQSKLKKENEELKQRLKELGK